MRHALQNDDYATWRSDPTDTRSEQEVLSASYSDLGHQALVDEERYWIAPALFIPIFLAYAVKAE